MQKIIQRFYQWKKQIIIGTLVLCNMVFLCVFSYIINQMFFSGEVLSGDIQKKHVQETHKSNVKPPFIKDVTIQHKNYLAITSVINKDLIPAYPDGSFQPNSTIARSELIRLLIKSQGTNPNPKIYHSCFIDVQSQLFAPYICYAKEKAFIQGFSDGRFYPTWEINRAEAAKIFLKAFDIQLLENIESDTWYNIYFASLHKKNLIEPDFFIQPRQKLTRADAAEMLYRIIDMKEKKADKYISSKNKKETEKLVAEPKSIIRNKPVRMYYKKSSPKVSDLQILFSSINEAKRYIRKNREFKKERINTYMSRNIRDVEFYYQPETSHGYLIIQIKGKETVHENVPMYIWEGFKRTDSIDKYYDEFLRSHYELSISK